MKKLQLLFAVCFLYMMTSASFAVVPPPSTDINTYVLFGYDRLSFKGGNQSAGWGIIYGNIGVNNAAANSSTISLEFATSGFAYMADGYQAVGDHVRGDAGGSFYDLYANQLNNNFGAEIRNNGPTPFTLPLIASLPVFPFTPNRALTNGPTDTPAGVATDFTVDKNGTWNPAPGAWRDVRIKDHAVVTLGPGTYNMRDVSIGKFVTFVVAETTIIQVDQTFQPNNNFMFGIGSNAGAEIFVGGYGINWTTTTVTNFSHYSEVHASYFAPTGWLDIGGKNMLYGHFWARSVSGDPNNNVYITPPNTTPPTDPCAPLTAGVISGNINDYVLFGFDQVEFKGGNLANGFGYIHGNVGVNNAAPTSSYLSLIFASSHSAWIDDGYIAVADRVRGDASGSFWDLYANDLNNNFASDIRNSGPTPWTPPILASTPPLPFTPGRALTSGAPDLTIAKNAIVSFSPPFTYNHVVIHDGAIVTFSAGTFDLWWMDIGKNVTINVDDATIFQIDYKFENNNGLMFGIGSHSGAQILVGGFGLGSNDKASNFSHGSELHAMYYAPTGVLDLGGQGNNLYGHYWARRITGDQGNTIFCEFPPVTNPNSPISSVNPGTKGTGIQISIFPNPAQEAFTLQITNAISQGSILTLQDMTGKEILRTSLQLQEGVSKYPVNISGIAPGVYIVRLNTVTGVGQTKLIINR